MHVDPKLSSLVVGLTILFANTWGHAAGFEQGLAADPAGKPLVIGVWYPSRAATKPVSLGPTTLNVAVGAALDGQALPMIVVSHGTGASYLSHFDTAIALADAGFVVVAMNHTGDNYADQSRSIEIWDRPRQVSRVIDHMLTTWPGHAAIDPRRIGIFGYSAGGFTALASVGGVPDFDTIGPMCRQYPGDFSCQLIAAHAVPVVAPEVNGLADPRIVAAVVAAPALGFTFAPAGLKNVNVPVQLWRAEDDVVLPHPRYAEAVRSALPQEPEYHVVSNAGHFDFLAPCSDALASMAPAICTSAPGFDRARFHAVFDAEVVKFFDATLQHR